jgi:phosphatidylserine decarboxylase
MHLAAFYYVFNLKPFSDNSKLQTPIRPESAGKPLAPVTKWLVDYAIIMGEWMATGASWSEEQERSFWEADEYNIGRYYRPEGGWKSFNDFFSRKLKHPNPVDGEKDDSVVVSPADCTYASPFVEVCAKAEVNIKAMVWDIDELIGLKSTNKGNKHLTSLPEDTFDGGGFVHAFLAPYDYHRQHAPVSGKVVVSRVIQGQCYLEVVEEVGKSKPGEPSGRSHLRPVRPIFADPGPGEVRDLEAPDSAGYQFLQTRGVIIIKNENLGYVAVLPVGMAQVSSVVPTVKEGDYVTKGQEISYFQMGGSDIIMVFQKKANVKLTVDTGNSGTHLTQGQQVIQAHYSSNA